MPENLIPDAELISLWHCDISDLAMADVYRSDVRRLSRAHGPLVECDPFTLRRFLKEQAEIMKPGTLGIVRRALRSFYRWAAENKIVTENPAEGLPPIRQPEPIVRIATRDTYTALMDACETPRDQAFIALLFGSGARRCEVVGLTLADVSIDQQTIRIRKSKTGRQRTAPITSEATRHLAVWLRVRLAQRSDLDALWPNRNGRPLQLSGARQLVRRVSGRAGVEIWSHDARRYFASEWLRQGGSETGLKASCGWSNVGMICIYTRNNAEALAQAEARRLFS